MISRFAIALFIVAGSAAIARPAPQGPAMPPGHAAPPAGQGAPQIDLEKAMEAGPRGVLAIRSIQGTNGGPAVGNDEIEVVLVHRGQPVKTIKSRLDENAMAMIGDLPVGIGVQPVVRIKHAGVLYQESGPMMDANTPRASMNITVYEVTDEQPKWKVLMRQVMAARLPTEMDVAELVTVESMGDKTWLGAPPNSEGRRDTVVLGVPQTAEKFNLQAGFHGWCCTAYSENGLHVQMPLMPGRMTYRFSYSVPIAEGSADLRVSASALTEQTTIVVPEDGSTVQAVELQPAGSETMQGTRVRLFKASGVKAGQPVGLVLTGLAASETASAPSAPAAPAPAAPEFPMPWAIAAGTAAVVTFGLVVWVKSQRRARVGGG